MLRKKVCMLGAFAVGKTSLVRRFVESIFSEEYFTTVGVRIEKKVVQSGGHELLMMLWDLSGDDEIQPLRMTYLEGASGLFYVVDGTRKDTLAKVRALKRDVDARVSGARFVLVLNKCDLTDEWEIDAEKEKELTSGGWSVFRTSAKTGEGVEQAFQALADEMTTK